MSDMGGEEERYERFTSVRVEGEVAVVRFESREVRGDPLNILLVGEELTDLLDSRHFVKVVVNLENVRFLGSGIVGKFVGLNDRLLNEKGRLALCCIDAELYEVFRITRINTLIPIFETEAEALAAVG